MGSWRRGARKGKEGRGRERTGGALLSVREEAGGGERKQRAAATTSTRRGRAASWALVGLRVRLGFLLFFSNFKIYY